MSAAETKAEPTWIDQAEAAAILGIHRQAVARLVLDGLITTRSLPVRARYLRADCERLARESVRPAVAGLNTHNDPG